MTVFDAIDGLISVIHAALPGVDVHDGPVGVQAETDHVIVAGAINEDHASGEQEFATIGWPPDFEEQFRISIVFGSYTGTDDQRAVRVRVKEMHNDLAAALAADGPDPLNATLPFEGAATVRLAALGGGGWSLDQSLPTSDDGSVITGRKCRLSTVVTVQARTSY